MDNTATYYDSAKGTTISQARALQEIEAHGAMVEDFIAAMGCQNAYDAQAVLRWLGY